jgi:DNA polymerase III delta prime subunit
MHVNCAHGKGIKFIREELKFFAKTHINSNGGFIFKSIVLLNADKLTMDAQSALRRCIELFSHNTRFFIIVEDKYKLLKPILSRFCEIYVHEPIHNGRHINLYKYNLNETYQIKSIQNLRIECLKKELLKHENEILSGINIIELSTKLYEKGYNGLDIINLVENPKFLNIEICKRYELLIAYNKVRKEFKNEKLLMIFIFNFLFLEKKYNLENISFI